MQARQQRERAQLAQRVAQSQAQRREWLRNAQALVRRETAESLQASVGWPRCRGG